MERMLWATSDSLHSGSAFVYALNAFVRYAEGKYHVAQYNDFEHEYYILFMSGNIHHKSKIINFFTKLYVS